MQRREQGSITNKSARKQHHQFRRLNCGLARAATLDVSPQRTVQQSGRKGPGLVRRRQSSQAFESACGERRCEIWPGQKNYGLFQSTLFFSPKSWLPWQKRPRAPLRHTSSLLARAKRHGARTSTSLSCKQALKMSASRSFKGTDWCNPFHNFTT